jgi:hypothetical protein
VSPMYSEYRVTSVSGSTEGLFRSHLEPDVRHVYSAVFGVSRTSERNGAAPASRRWNAEHRGDVVEDRIRQVRAQRILDRLRSHWLVVKYPNSGNESSILRSPEALLSWPRLLYAEFCLRRPRSTFEWRQPPAPRVW